MFVAILLAFLLFLLANYSNFRNEDWRGAFGIGIIILRILGAFFL